MIDDSLRVIFVCDGNTDYLFLEKILKTDEELSQLKLQLLRPEDVGLKRRTGGGHLTLLRESQQATMKAAQGYADAVFVVVDNDCDKRFTFPHKVNCGDCRECEVIKEINKVYWAGSIKKLASVMYQAVETVLLSAFPGFTAQIEDNLCGKNLKDKLYRREIQDPEDQAEAFQSILSRLNVSDIRARIYPQLKLKLQQLRQSSL